MGKIHQRNLGRRMADGRMNAVKAATCANLSTGKLGSKSGKSCGMSVSQLIVIPLAKVVAITRTVTFLLRLMRTTTSLGQQANDKDCRAIRTWFSSSYFKPKGNVHNIRGTWCHLGCNCHDAWWLLLVVQPSDFVFCALIECSGFLFHYLHRPSLTILFTFNLGPA